MWALMVAKSYPPGMVDGSNTAVCATCMCTDGVSKVKKAVSRPERRSMVILGWREAARTADRRSFHTGHPTTWLRARTEPF